MRKSFAVLPIAAVLLAGCLEEGASRKESRAVEQQQKQFLASQPVPSFDWSLERDVVVQLYAARNERVATHSVWRSSMGTIDDHCPSVGYPIPADTSLTNPLMVGRGSSAGYAVIEQPEPNGLFSSKNTYGTWVRCIEEISGVAIEMPIYIESNVTTYPYPVEVDFDNNRVKRAHGARPSLVIKASNEKPAAAKPIAPKE